MKKQLSVHFEDISDTQKTLESLVKLFEYLIKNYAQEDRDSNGTTDSCYMFVQLMYIYFYNIHIALNEEEGDIDENEIL